MICPNCQNKMYFCLDEWGHTPWHLHCDNCEINIGATSQKKTINLIQKYHSPKTWIEYYAGKIQILCVNGNFIKNETGV